MSARLSTGTGLGRGETHACDQRGNKGDDARAGSEKTNHRLGYRQPKRNHIRNVHPVCHCTVRVESILQLLGKEALWHVPDLDGIEPKIGRRLGAKVDALAFFAGAVAGEVNLIVVC